MKSAYYGPTHTLPNTGQQSRIKATVVVGNLGVNGVEFSWVQSTPSPLDATKFLTLDHLFADRNSR